MGVLHLFFRLSSHQRQISFHISTKTDASHLNQLQVSRALIKSAKETSNLKLERKNVLLCPVFLIMTIVLYDEGPFIVYM